MKNILLGLTMVVALLTAGYLARPLKPSELVYEVCNRSRIDPYITEKRCAELQDAYHIEFLCQEANQSKDNKCWTEQHGKDWTR